MASSTTDRQEPQPILLNYTKQDHLDTDKTGQYLTLVLPANYRAATKHLQLRAHSLSPPLELPNEDTIITSTARHMDSRVHNAGSCLSYGAT